ncbi:hypothetical protein [Telmatospirillum sp.]|uniref:hypothetical protein n=1 Tax=Telmatospirillum sp. TaxID=2079197 RepID=UPI0028419D06|nr:hypothetical protein [Telmatospirillum sp.]MDR3436312.1 hypothetical protein [Telmatospirillum sp.]
MIDINRTFEIVIRVTPRDTAISATQDGESIPLAGGNHMFGIAALEAVLSRAEPRRMN